MKINMVNCCEGKELWIVISIILFVLWGITIFLWDARSRELKKLKQMKGGKTKCQKKSKKT